MTGSETADIHLCPQSAKGSATSLVQAFRDQLGRPVVVDSSAVEHLGAACLSVLICAHARWKTDAIQFQISNPSEAFLRGLDLFGLSLSDLGQDGA